MQEQGKIHLTIYSKIPLNLIPKDTYAKHF